MQKFCLHKSSVSSAFERPIGILLLVGCFLGHELTDNAFTDCALFENFLYNNLFHIDFVS